MKCGAKDPGPDAPAATGVRRLGKIDVRVATTHEAALELIHAIHSRDARLFTFCNSATVNLAQGSAEFCRVLDRATVFNDGVGVDIGSLILYGRGFEYNLNGTDFIPAVFDMFDQPVRLFLLGSAPGVAASAAEALQRRHPTLDVVGTQHGYFQRPDSSKIAAAIKAAEPDLVLIGMGQPIQELWAAEHVDAVGVPFLCVGAFMDFASGRVSRAPILLRRARAEWLYRLMREPRRLTGRYIGGALPFISRIVMQRMTGNGGKF